ncbi:transposase [Streptomyces sp. NPDC056943]|uniref:IS110 family transposase n=1 Tax=Streptomyces sp. NPDC056943 TaxID=3345971 RepID=UPI00364356E5
MNRIWAGIDSGKTHHHCVTIDQDGAKLLSRRVPNGELYGRAGFKLLCKRVLLAL